MLSRQTAKRLKEEFNFSQVIEDRVDKLYYCRPHTAPEDLYFVVPGFYLIEKDYEEIIYIPSSAELLPKNWAIKRGEDDTFSIAFLLEGSYLPLISGDDFDEAVAKAFMLNERYNNSINPTLFGKILLTKD